MAKSTGTILRPGVFATAGGEVELTSEVLAAIAEAYDAAVYKAPLVLGHPTGEEKGEMLAMGYVEGLRQLADGSLEADIEASSGLSWMLGDGQVLAHSAGLYAENDESNPAPGVRSLHHLAFLGATPPAIKSLKKFEFSESGGAAETLTLPAGQVQFAQAKGGSKDNQEKPSMKEDQGVEAEGLRKELAETKALLSEAQKQIAAEAEAGAQRAAAEFAEKLVEEGRLVAGERERVAKTILSAQKADASAGTQLAEELRNTFAALPKKQVPEIATQFSAAPAEKTLAFAPTAEEVTKFAEENKVTPTVAYDRMINQRQEN